MSSLEKIFSQKMHDFVGDLSVKQLPQLIVGFDDGVSVVAVRVDSVVEGIDMWYCDDDSKNSPRLLLHCILLD
jgi:hypothetical protein